MKVVRCNGVAVESWRVSHAARLLLAALLLALCLCAGFASAGSILVQGQFNSSSNLYVGSGLISFFVNATSGRVGIGTSNPNASLQVIPSASSVSGGSGGDVADVLDGGVAYRVHRFATVGSSNFTVPAGVGSVQVLVVAGGGGGGNGGGAGAGGGGAGGLVYSSSYPVTAGQSIAVTVGAGGAGASSWHFHGGNGNNSTFGSIIAIGGGGGGSYYSVSEGGGGTTGYPGGSGGGAGFNGSSSTSTGGAGTVGQGYPGGNSYAVSPYPAGGGGGAGEAGGTANGIAAGNGGAGLAYDISGTLSYYAGGGGGAVSVGGVNGVGGLGGGGNGELRASLSSTAGTNGTGGGGGGGNVVAGAAGGSGVVIVRYQLYPGTMRVDGISFFNGSVGIGTSTPYAKLDVNGSIKVGSSTVCDSNAEGSIKYDSVAKRVKFCNGTAWMPLQAVSCGANLGSCKQIFEGGCSNGDGIYFITPTVGNPFQVYCDMANGGWTMCAYSDNTIDIADANSANVPTPNVVGTRKCSNITDFSSVRATSGNNSIALAGTVWFPSGFSNKNSSVVSYNISTSGQNPRSTGFIKANATSYALCVKTSPFDETDSSYNYKRAVCIGDWNRLICDSGQCNLGPTYATTQAVFGTAFHYNSYNYCQDVSAQDWLFYNYGGENQACYATNTVDYYEPGNVSIWVK